MSFLGVTVKEESNAKLANVVCCSFSRCDILSCYNYYTQSSQSTMANTTAIFTLPTNFSADQRASKSNDPQKQLKRSSSTSTALTELSSVCASSACSVGTSDDDLDNFLDALEEAICPDDQVTPVDDTLTKLLGYEQGYKEISGEAARDVSTELKAADDARVDTLALKVAELQGRHNREERQMRRLKRQARILKAQAEYIECLSALASGSKEVTDEEFLKEHGMTWKEVEIDWDS